MMQGVEGYAQELEQMCELNWRADIEGLYAHGPDALAEYICMKVVQGDYL